MSRADVTAQELNAFIDGELELTKQLDLEARLAGDAALRDEVEQLRSVRDAVRSRADYHAAPDALRVRLQPAAACPPLAPVRAARFVWRHGFAWRPLVITCSMAGLLVWALSLTFWQPSPDERLMQEVIASHVRSTLGERLVDVASSDRHTVKPALAAKLDFSPPVAEPPVPGVSLVGGRVDYLDGRLVAALVYRQHQHVIDAYVWPGGPADEAMRSASQRGFNTVHWAQDGMRFWLVSDLNHDELAGFAQALAKTAAR
jgi:anti-sigma factor RsiW